MKKLFLLFALMVIASTSYAQVYKMYKTRNYHNQLRLNTMTGEVQQIQDDGQSWEICSAREILGDKEGRFRLYETQNMWTFIIHIQVRIGKSSLVSRVRITCLQIQSTYFLLHILRSRQIGLIDFRCLPLKTCGHLYCWTHIMDDYGKFNIVHKI